MTDRLTIGRQIGRFVAAHRLTSRLSQRQLAEKIGLSRQSIQYIESGSKLPSYPTLYSLAAAFGVEPAALLPSRKQVK